jgi:hypothetical protein
LHGHGAAKIVDDPLDDRQAQPGAVSETPAAAKERLENAIDILGWNSRSSILNRNNGAFIGTALGDWMADTMD